MAKKIQHFQTQQAPFITTNTPVTSRQVCRDATSMSSESLAWLADERQQAKERAKMLKAAANRKQRESISDWIIYLITVILYFILVTGSFWMVPVCNLLFAKGCN